jgi:uncharacterized RDD family membrane protein YckC
MRQHSGVPGIGRRLLSLVYELLLLSAVIFLAGGVATAVAEITGSGHRRIITQLAVASMALGYFVWQWHSRGQTLPMKTWRMRLQTATGDRPSPPQALLRALLCIPGYGLCAVTILWALADHDGQFLHDRLAGTRLVNTA